MARIGAKTDAQPKAQSKKERQQLLEKLRANAHIWAETRLPYEQQSEEWLKENGEWTKESRQENRRRIKREMDAIIQDPSYPSEIVEDGAIQRWHFQTAYGPYVYEKLLHISITDDHPFERTKFLTDFNELCASWYDKNPSPCVEALQLELAKLYHAMPKGYLDSRGHHKTPGKHIQTCYDGLWAMPGGESDWNRVKDEHVDLLRDEDPERQPLRKILQEVLEKWSRWKQYAVDYSHNNRRNSFTSTNKGYYREPPADAKYVLLDRNGKLVIFLDPKGIDDAYELGVLGRMKDDTDNYFAIKKPASTEGKQRWRGDKEHFELNPHLTKDDCGTDYYGGWHAAGHPDDPMHMTPDAKNLQPDEKEVLLEYLKGTNGLMNRLVDYWFGVFDPELQQEYRDVYKAVPENARLPPTCDEEEETFTLKAFLRNRQTYEHVDKEDWYGGLVGLSHIGEFTGGAFCLNQLRLKLNGYRSGAVLLFRGNLLKHFVQSWQGKRTAFDFTTKETVRRMGQRLNSLAKNATEQNVAASTGNHTSEAEYRERPEDLDPSTGASDATSLGKRRRPQIEEADDTSDLPRPSPTTWDRNPVRCLEAITARALSIDGSAGLATPAGTSNSARGMSTLEEFRPTLLPRVMVPQTIIEIDHFQAKQIRDEIRNAEIQSQRRPGPN